MLKLHSNTSLLILAFFVIICMSCQPHKDKRLAEQLASLEFKIGENFPFHHFVDSAGILISIDFWKSEVTIIDFWFNACPPCIDEMKKFESAIAGKNVSIVSVSINSFQEWRKTFSNNSSTFQFLQRKVPNWNHYVMKSEVNPKLNNKISFDAQKKLVDDLGVKFYPAYFVVNKMER